MKNRNLAIIGFGIILAAQNGFGQQTGVPSSPAQTTEQRDRGDYESRRKALGGLNEAYINNNGIVRAKRLPGKIDLPEKVRKELEAAAAPNHEDTAQYKSFLKQSKTGLFRLMPNLGCNLRNVIRVDGDCSKAIFTGEYYSFRWKEYASEDYFDITFKDGNLVSQGFISQGILVALGDTPLENVSLESAGVKFLVDYKPQEAIEEAKKQFAELSTGIDSANFKYSNAIKAANNTTYALRIIPYQVDSKVIKRALKDGTPENYRFAETQVDKRIDTILAFRIIRQDENGCLSILWRQLDIKDAPKLVFQKDEILSNISQ